MTTFNILQQLSSHENKNWKNYLCLIPSELISNNQPPIA